MTAMAHQTHGSERIGIGFCGLWSRSCALCCFRQGLARKAVLPLSPQECHTWPCSTASDSTLCSLGMLPASQIPAETEYTSFFLLLSEAFSHWGRGTDPALPFSGVGLLRRHCCELLVSGGTVPAETSSSSLPATPPRCLSSVGGIQSQDKTLSGWAAGLLSGCC